MKTSILILPLFLTGCFIYDNLKQGYECSFDQTKCPEYTEKQQSIEQKQKEFKISQDFEKEEKIYQKKAEHLNHQKCTLLGNKIGTADYALCRDGYDRMFKLQANLSGSKQKTYLSMKKTYNRDKKTCLKYGIKRNSKEYTSCLILLELDRLKAHKNAANNSPIQQPLPRHCRTIYTHGMSETSCY